MIRFIAELTCDHAPCTETARVGVAIEMDRGCSPFGGPMCTAELEPDMGAAGWQDLGNGKTWCPLCWADQFRFEVRP